MSLLSSPTHDPTQPARNADALRILLSNDDGIHAPGLLAIKLALEGAGHQVTVCAPNRPRSAASHAITMHKPLRLQQTRLDDGTTGWAVSGTPADCVVLGLDEVLKGECDLVVSGINHGPNLGWDVIYSGTVAAAMEAVILGYPAIAVSAASYEAEIEWEAGASFVAQTLVGQVARHGLPPYTLLNVNAPSLPPDQIRGVRVTSQGDRQYVDRLDKRLDPNGKPYYWLGGKIHDRETAPGTDTRAVGDGYIAVTPVQIDMTAQALLRDLKTWGLER